MAEIKKSIVILGAGFAGLKTALLLAKKIAAHPEYQILLVDERAEHVYSPDLYEIATAYNKKLTQECLTMLSESVATPFPKILSGEPLLNIRDRVISIHPEKREVLLRINRILPYEFLVLCLGSVTNYYSIPGLTQFSYPLKTLPDALAICCHLDTYFHTLWKEATKKNVNIIVGGGGATGVELACELPRYLDKICRKYGYPRENVSVMLLEGSAELTGQGEQVTQVILERFRALGIGARLETFIQEVTVNSVRVKSKKGGEELPCDILIWTGGVMAHPLVRASFLETAKNGALPVDAFLSSQKNPHVFAAGDNAFFIDPRTGKAAPLLAQMAVQQARVVSHNILAMINGGKKIAFEPRLKGVIIPLGGKYALFRKGNIVFKGFWVWLLRRFVDLGYLLGILPFRYAVKKWIHATNVFVGND